MVLHQRILTQEGFVDKDSLFYPFEERGLQFGDGIYEVIRIYQGNYYLLEEHTERLYRSADAVRLSMPFPMKEMYQLLDQLLKENNISGDAKVYLQVTRGTAEREHTFPDCPANLYAYVKDTPRPVTDLNSGVKTITHEDIRWQHCYIKSLNLLPNILAKQTAKEQGCYEAILHRDGKITECSSSNAYIVKNGVIYTHPATVNILHGCVRSRILTLAAGLHIPVKEEAFLKEDLFTADEVFLSSSTGEVMPIIEVDGSTIQTGQPGSITRLLQAAYEKDAGIQHSAFTATL